MRIEEYFSIMIAQVRKVFKEYLLVDRRIGAQHGEGVYDCPKDIQSPVLPKCLCCSGLSLCVSFAVEELCFSAI